MNMSEAVVIRHTREADRMEAEAAELEAGYAKDPRAWRLRSQAAAHRRLAAKKSRLVERTY